MEKKKTVKRTSEDHTIANPTFRRILHGYNEDTIVIMPVNGDTNFIYWEITEELLKRKKKTPDSGSERLMIRVFEEESEREIYSFKVNNRIGKHYMKFCGSQERLVADIGFVRGETFVSILKSTPTTVSSFAEEAGNHEIWMQKVEYSCEIVQAPTDNVIARNGLQSLFEEYYSDCMASRSGSISGSMSLSLP